MTWHITIASLDLTPEAGVSVVRCVAASTEVRGAIEMTWHIRIAPLYLTPEVGVSVVRCVAASTEVCGEL